MKLLKMKIAVRLIISLLLYSSWCNGQIMISEYSCANLNSFVDDHNDYGDWIELYNASNNDVDISGYFLSDDPAELNKFQVPAGTVIGAQEFMIYWASGRGSATPDTKHTNFKLSQTKNTNEVLSIADAAMTIMDSVTIKKTQLGHSRGRLNNTGDWYVLTQPNPGETNGNSPTFIAYADRPDFEPAAGFYADSVQVTLINNEPNSILRYTLNGNEPTASSTEYIGPITITATTVLKAKSFSTVPGILPGFIEYATYFINVAHTLPIISIAGNQLTQLANGDNSLRPHGSTEYFRVDGNRAANGYGEFNSHGQDSWVNDHRSLDIVIRDEMGYAAELKEKFFELTERTKFQRLILRAAGDDNYPGNFLPEHEGCAHVRDAYIQNIAKRANLQVDVRTATKAIVYLNGNYWGLYDIREIPDDHDYTEEYYNQDKYDLQYILTWGDTWAEYGGVQALEDWDEFYNYVMGNDMTIPEHLNYVKDNLDILSLIDYVIFNSISVCTDWLNYNTGWWRGSNPEGTHKKWGYILWDNDATFGYYINYTGVPDDTPTALPCNAEGLVDPDLNGHLAILNRLLMTEEIRQLYVSRYIDLMNTAYSCENMLGQLDSVRALIMPEMAMQAARWGGSVQDWNTNFMELRTFIMQRCQAMNEGLNECYDLTGPFQLVVDADPTGSARIKINSLDIPSLPYTGNYHEGIDILIHTTAQANDYQFDSWQSTGSNYAIDDPMDSTTVINIMDDASITAHYIDLSTGYIDNQAGNQEMKLSPNIVHTIGHLNFTIPAEKTYSLYITSLDGKVLEIKANHQMLGVGNYQIAIDFSKMGLSTGQYYLVLEASGSRQSLPFYYTVE